ncbi:MAG TPA: YbaB/EbfC family nucleoid-associated protein [Tepidiformaceae bacterium]|nr:YbaB/EbfC family nucleoid-associated protein [Tepidiformaceae bacterium]
MAKSSGNNRYLRRGGGGGGLPGRSSMGGGANPNALAQAQEMLARAQAELAATTVEGSAGGGAVRVTMSGEQKITAITLSPDVVDPDDVEMLQDLIMAAISDASEKATDLQSQSFGAITGGLGLPGLGL